MKAGDNSGAQSAEELLSRVLGGASTAEMLEALSDDVNVLWLAQQSNSVEPDEFGLFVNRMQSRTDVIAELARRERSQPVTSNVVPFAGRPTS